VGTPITLLPRLHVCLFQNSKFFQSDMHEFEIRLQFSLKSQVLKEVERCISGVSGSAKIAAAKKVVEFLTSANDQDYVELSVKFMESLIQLMIMYVNGLVSERVAILSSAESKNIGAAIHSEISECDQLLRSLRRLQTDMSNRVPIHEGTYTPVKVLHRTNKLPLPRLDGADVSNVDRLVERSILTRSSSSGYHMGLTFSSFHDTGNLMRARARLIAYLFLCSQQMDAFFIGIDLLRQSGQHVSKVLTAIFLNTSIKFVRDRIWNHLSHKESSHSSLLALVPLVRQFEQQYPINCYDTQMNRRWSGIEGVVVGQASDNTTNSPPLIQCGNIADVSQSLLGDHANIGNIGNLTLDESNSILRCSSCAASVETLVGTTPTTTTISPGDGYMHMTVAWLNKMTQKETKMIFLKDTTPHEQFDFLAQQHDWSNLIKFLDDVNIDKVKISDFKVPDRSPVSQLVNEKIFALSRPTKVSSPQSLAKVGLFLTNESVVSNHETNLSWLMEQSSNVPPQVLTIYLRRFGKWDTDIENLRIDDDRHRIPIHGRLGISQLPYVSRLMSTMNREYNMDLIRLCECMFEGVPDNSDLGWITRSFPQLEPFLRPIEDPKNSGFSNIYDMRTNKGDVSIRELLSDVHPAWCGWNLKLDDSPAAASSPKFSVEYLLAQGRPSRAFLVNQSHSLQLSARRVAFYNLFDDGIVASAISFLDLCGESTETLRVDIQSARSILGPNHPTKKRLDEVVSVFLSFGNGHSDNLLKALKMLEEAAWIQEPPTGSGGDSLPTSAGTAAAGESPWHLVALFCRVHNLPRSLTLLHELARNGDWVMFLHESDLQQCPIDTVRDVVRLYFVDNPLRNHLNILLDQGGEEDGEEDDQKLLGSSLIVETPPPPSSPAELLAKYLSLFQFEKARLLIEEFSDNEDLIQVLNHHFRNDSFLFESEVKALSRVAVAACTSESLSTPIAVVEDDIGSLDASSFKGTLRGSSSSGVMVESLLTDDEDEANLLDQIRQALGSGQGGLGSLRDKIIHEGLFRQYYGMLVNHFDRVSVKVEDEYLELVRVVSIDVRDSFGEFLMNKLGDGVDAAPELEYVTLRRDVCILAYYAISSSFSDELHDRLIEYIKTDERLREVREEVATHVSELHLEELEAKRTVDVTISASTMLETCRKRLQTESEATVADLHCLLRIGQIYADCVMLRRHLEANEVLNAVARRLKSSGLV